MERGIGDNSEAAVGDWIALARSTAEHWLVGFGQPVKPADKKRGAFSRGEAWIDLIMLARWKPGQENNKGRKVDLDSGQLQGGYEYLAGRWNWTVKQVRLFLSKLIGEAMIEKNQPDLSTSVNLSSSEKDQKQGTKKGKQSSNQIQIITLCNYGKYQVAKELLELEKGQAERQARGKRGASEGQDLNKETKKQKDNNNHHSRETAPESGGGDIPDLNGATAIVVEKLAGWIRPSMPDRVTARATLENLVKIYSPGIVRDSFAHLEAKMLSGDIVPSPIKYFTGTCRGMQEQATKERKAAKAKIHRRPRSWD